MHFFGDKERAHHEVYITPSEDGTKLICRYKKNNELVPPSPMEKSFTYVWGIDKKFYIVDNNTILRLTTGPPSIITWDTWKTKGQVVKHSSIFAGQPVLSAGKAYFGKDGAMLGINYVSGHYHPNMQSLTMMYQSFKDQQYNATLVTWVGRLDWSEGDCDLVKWDEIDESLGFDAASLEKSCHEVTNSPMFVQKDDEEENFPFLQELKE